MKHKNWVLALLAAAFLILFVGYRWYDDLSSDTQAPTIHMDDSQVLCLSVHDPKSMLLQGVTASDDRDGSVTGSLVVESVYLLNGEGAVEVSYAVADSAGNVAKATRQVQYTDYESPRFSLQAPLVYYELQRFDILDNIGATDAIDGDIQHRIRATSMTEDTLATAGTHTIRFQVHNSLGDSTELVLPVEVWSTNSFNSRLSLTDYLIYLPVGATFEPKTYLDSFSGNNETVSLRKGLPEDFRMETDGKVDTSVEGVYAVSYTVTHTVRHATNSDYDQHYTGYSKLIVVVEG